MSMLRAWKLVTANRVTFLHVFGCLRGSLLLQVLALAARRLLACQWWLQPQVIPPCVGAAGTGDQGQHSENKVIL